jgi:hypothetical protein
MLFTSEHKTTPNSSRKGLELTLSSMAQMKRSSQVRTQVTRFLRRQVRDWNVDFQDLLDQDDSLEKFTSLRSLAEDFIYVAEMYGK